jgi:hypothetical protein
MAAKNRFIANGPELETLTGFSPHSVRTQHCTGRGALVPLLCKFGDRLGLWEADWREFADSQRRFKRHAAPEGDRAA